MVTVTTSSGPVQVNGTDWYETDQHDLTVVDDQGADVETFAAGTWTSAAVVPS